MDADGLPTRIDNTLALTSLLRAAEAEEPRILTQWMYGKDYEPRTTEAVDKMETLPSAMKALAETKGIPIVFVVVPTRERVCPEDYDFSVDAFTTGYDLDLLPIFRQTPRDTLFCYALDHRWNERGNALAGRAIAEPVVEQGLVARRGRAGGSGVGAGERGRAAGAGGCAAARVQCSIGRGSS